MQINGELAEWLNAAALKAAVGGRPSTGGSNPPLSSTKSKKPVGDFNELLAHGSACHSAKLRPIRCHAKHRAEFIYVRVFDGAEGDVINGAPIRCGGIGRGEKFRSHEAHHAIPHIHDRNANTGHPLIGGGWHTMSINDGASMRNGPHLVRPNAIAELTSHHHRKQHGAKPQYNITGATYGNSDEKETD